MSKQHKSRSQVNKKAILLAHFGTTYPSALPSLEHIKQQVQESFPGIETRICFTSNIVRNIWAERRKEPDFWLKQGVSEEVLYAQGFLGAIGNLQDENYRTIIVQPTHIYHGEQYEDLKSFVHGLHSIQTVKKAWRPFEKVVLSRPALGTCGVLHDYSDDIDEVVQILEEDVSKAKKMQATLLYVAHGNDFFSSGVFHETRNAIREAYADVNIHIGMIEGYPSLDDILKKLKNIERKNILIKPFMITAGDHAHKDIDNHSPESWRGSFEGMGFTVVTEMEGLGSNTAFARLFAKRIMETAEDYGIDLTSDKTGNVS